MLMGGVTASQGTRHGAPYFISARTMALEDNLAVQQVFPAAASQEVEEPRLGVQGPGRPDFIDCEPAGFEHFPVSSRTKPAQMGRVKNAAVLITPTSTQQRAD